jgi:hypothetical protein
MKVMAISNTQEGVITEAEFVKVVILTTDGKAVPARPVADDEHRDFEVHLRRNFRWSIAIQSKTSKRLKLVGKSRILQIHFRITGRVISDPRFWYFFAHFDVKAMRFSDPVFLVPSEFVHRHARTTKIYGQAQFAIYASMEPKSRDKWAPYRLTQAELGPRLLEILQSLGSVQGSAPHLLELAKRANLWVQPKARAARRSNVRRAA